MSNLNLWCVVFCFLVCEEYIPLLPTPGAPTTAIFNSVKVDFLRLMPRVVILGRWQVYAKWECRFVYSFCSFRLIFSGCLSVCRNFSNDGESGGKLCEICSIYFLFIFFDYLFKNLVFNSFEVLLLRVLVFFWQY